MILWYNSSVRKEETLPERPVITINLSLEISRKSIWYAVNNDIIELRE